MTENALHDNARLDNDTLDELESMVGPEALSGIIERHMSLCAKELPAVEALTGPDDIETLRQTAHSLKGAFVSVGAPTAGGLARRLEEAAAEGNCSAAHALVPEFLTEAQADLAALRERFLS